MKLSVVAILGFSLGLSFSFLVCNNSEAASSNHRKIASEKPEIRKIRLSHARELLGKYYSKSIVKSGEQIKDIGGFVADKLNERLPEKYKKKSAKIQKAIMKESATYRFDPVFLLAVIENESHFKPHIVGSVGEIGLMQIRPATAKWICEKYNIKWRGKSSLKDPITNIRIGAAFLDYLRDDFEKHGRLYLSAYNMGGGNVRQFLDEGVWPKEYAVRVMEQYIKMYTEISDGEELKKQGKT